MTAMRDVAYGLAARGYLVFPLQPRGKLPFSGRSWKALICHDEMAAWELWSRPEYAEANVGVNCRGLIVVDVDEGKKPGALAAYKALGYPITYTVRTPSGGFHFYFKADHDVSNSNAGFPEGIDIRGAGGYVVGPGSVAAGGEYEALDDASARVVPAPADLIDRCTTRAQSTEQKAVDWTARGTPTANLADAKDFLARARVAVQGANGDATTYEVCAAMHDRGVYPSEALELLIAEGGWNDRCIPPWEPDDLRKKVENAYAYAQNGFGARSATAMFSGVVIPPQAQPRDPFRPLSAASFAGLDIPPREWLVEGWIPLGHVTLLYGDGAVGKSLAALQLCHSAVTGSPWLGMPLGRQGPAVYFSAEDDEDEIHRRLSGVLRSQPGVDFAGLRDLHVVPLYGEDSVLARFDRSGAMVPAPLWGRLISFLEREQPVLLVVDNLADVFAGDEVDRAQARAFMNLLHSICANLGTTLVVLAHPSRSGMATGDGTSGNTAWSNSVRSRLYMEREPAVAGRAADEDVRLISVKKTNYSRRGDPVRLRWSQGVFVVASDDVAARNAARKELADLMVAETPPGARSMALLDAARSAVAANHADAVLLYRTSSKISDVKTWLVQELAGGVRTTAKGEDVIVRATATEIAW